MTPDEQAKIERDRRRREALLLALLLAFGERALLHARAAIRVGADPVKSAVDVIVGSGGGPHVQHSGLSVRAKPLLQEAFAAGFANGLEQGGGTDGEPLTPANAHAFVSDYASTLGKKTADAIGRVSSAAMDLARADGLSTSQTLAAMSEAFRTAGLHRDSSRGFESAAERAVVTVRGSGQWTGWHVPNLIKKITGFRHHSTLDQVTTEICRERDGLTLPIDDPYWLVNVPALHWNCRSLLAPVFGEQRWTATYPATIAATGFGIAPPLFFGLPIGRAA